MQYVSWRVTPPGRGNVEPSGPRLPGSAPAPPPPAVAGPRGPEEHWPRRQGHRQICGASDLTCHKTAGQNLPMFHRIWPISERNLLKDTGSIIRIWFHRIWPISGGESEYGVGLAQGPGRRQH